MIFMTDKTEQKIMDAALEIFAKNGFKSSTTKVIAEKSGFTEMTLFRKFSTKKNLYEMVLKQNVELMLDDFKQNVFDDVEYENVKDFIANFIIKTQKVMMDNFEVFYISLNEENKSMEKLMAKQTDSAGNYLKKHIKNPDIDYDTLGISIISFVYIVNLENYHNRKASFGKSADSVVENFIEMVYCMVK
ncbi:MAG: TetR/AcrR family transcriptional regulator [Methanobacterium sp.]|nr:TetR/AcrR family transcriptional regulator [Methanobacterium sp.]